MKTMLPVRPKCSRRCVPLRESPRKPVIILKHATRISTEQRNSLNMPRSRLSGPISRGIAILSVRYPISRDTFQGRLALPQNGAIRPPWYLVSEGHICAIPHFATYRAIIVRYPIKTSTKCFCDTIATSIVRYEKYRCWASKDPDRSGASPKQLQLQQRMRPACFRQSIPVLKV